MFRANLEIFDRVGLFSTDGNELFISDEYNLMRIRNNEKRIFMSMVGYGSFVFEKDGMWLNYDWKSEKRGTAKFIDIYNKNISYPDLAVEVSNRDCFVGGDFIGSALDFLFVASKENGNIIKLEGKYALGVVVFAEKIFARKKRGKLVCYDMEFNEKWCVKLPDKKCFSGIFNGPQNYDRLIILNVGEIRSPKRGEFELNAYSAEDGSLQWQLIFPTCPHSSNVIGDKVYVSILDKIMVIDAATGKTLIEKPHGFKSNSHHMLYPYQDKLLATSSPDGKIHVFDENGNKIQEIFIPEEYGIGHKVLPVNFDGKLYESLGAKTMYGRSSALLTLTPDEIADKTIQLKTPPEPPFYVSVITTLKDENEHVVTISHDNLDEIILYATILLKEIGVETSSRLDLGKRDPKHNGTLRLYVDPDPLEDPRSALEKLQIVKDKVEWHLKSHYETAGNNKKEFKVLIKMK